jgi:hypothetical protein
MTALDPANSLQHYPMPMARFGLNPFGENRFRIILAASRRSLVYGQWNGAGTPRAKWVQTYPHLSATETYVLEEWVDAFTFTGGVTAEQWNSDSQLNILGPYPHRGEYQMCGNTGFDPAQTNIEKLIRLVHASDRYSWSEKLVAARNQATKEEIERKHLRESIIRDALPAFGHAPFSQLSTGRGGAPKTSPVIRSANELGLPIPQGIPGQATAGGGKVRKQRKRAA